MIILNSSQLSYRSNFSCKDQNMYEIKHQKNENPFKFSQYLKNEKQQIKNYNNFSEIDQTQENSNKHNETPYQIYKHEITFNKSLKNVLCQSTQVSTMSQCERNNKSINKRFETQNKRNKCYYNQTYQRNSRQYKFGETNDSIQRQNKIEKQNRNNKSQKKLIKLQYYEKIPQFEQFPKREYQIYDNKIYADQKLTTEYNKEQIQKYNLGKRLLQQYEIKQQQNRKMFAKLMKIKNNNKEISDKIYRVSAKFQEIINNSRSKNKYQMIRNKDQKVYRNKSMSQKYQNQNNVVQERVNINGLQVHQRQRKQSKQNKHNNYSTFREGIISKYNYRNQNIHKNLHFCNLK